MTAAAFAKSFHAYADAEPIFRVGFSLRDRTTTKYYVIQERDVSYRMYPHFHPYVGSLVNRLLVKSTAGLQAADTEYVTKADGTLDKLPDGKNKPVLYADLLTSTRYAPSALVDTPYPVKDLDFTTSGAYSDYNYELFFHVPLTIAIHLSKNQRFADAQRWFHYIFDPTDDSNGPTPERFWKVRPFQYTDVRKIEDILVNLSTGDDPQLRDDTIRSIEAWKDAPFRPHVIARYRQQAYMYKTVMAYLDNLIAWGDSLFREDTGEAVDEALMKYVLAANILGPRPLAVPKKGSIRPQNYANLRGDLDKFGNAMRELEADAPFDLMPLPTAAGGGNEQLATLRSMSKALYFSVPRNDKLLAYWDTVADRLFKIHNSLNFQGVFRQLALFAPPIDPALLARSTAAGLDIAAVVNGVNQPLPLVRFSVLIQKAAEFCQEVKALGSALLTAMEKEDGEAMQILRARHESAMLARVEQVRYAQLQEATKAKEALLRSLAVAVQRYTYFERHLGRKEDEIQQSIPLLDDLDRDALEKLKLTASEPDMALRPIDVDIADDVFAAAAGALSGGRILSSHDVREGLLLESAQLASDIGNILSFAGSIAHLFPTAKVHAQPWGIGGTVEYGGRNVGDGLMAGSGAARAIAERLNFEARRAARIDGFARREREWAYQSNLAAGEIAQTIKQLRGAQLREAIADLELRNHREQQKQAAEIEEFLNEEGTEKKGKKTNKPLYAWMKRELKAHYGRFFQFTFDTTRKTERALQRELGDPNLSILQYDYLAGKEGLLAGEKLYLDIRRMEMAYHDLNQREYEITRHVSLLQLNPIGLLQLRKTGRCTLSVPETLFDMDTPGHYFRRIKSVAVSIPCVAGPYASVNCTLTLLKSSIRSSPVLRDGGYARENADDDRFSDYFGSTQSTVTSSAQNDAGLFELNLHDERYLPFEHAGAISEWQIELSANPARKEPVQFDYDRLADVILTIRHTGRPGGGLLRNAAMANVKSAIELAAAIGSTRLFSMREEFPSEWARFQAQTPAAGDRFELAIQLREEHFPFWSRGRLNSVPLFRIVAESAAAAPPPTIDVFDKANDGGGAAKKDTLVKDPVTENQLHSGAFANIALPPKPIGDLKLYFASKELKDVWLAVAWSSV